MALGKKETIDQLTCINMLDKLAGWLAGSAAQIMQPVVTPAGDNCSECVWTLCNFSNIPACSGARELSKLMLKPTLRFKLSTNHRCGSDKHVNLVEMSLRQIALPRRSSG